MKNSRKTLAVLSLLAILMALSLAVGCTGQDSPGEIVKKHLNLLDQRRFKEFYNMHAAGYLPDRETYINSLEDSFPEGASITNIQVLQEDTQGDTATVKVRYTKELPGVPVQDVEADVELVKENGIWKIAGGI